MTAFVPNSLCKIRKIMDFVFFCFRKKNGFKSFCTSSNLYDLMRALEHLPRKNAHPFTDILNTR